MMTENENPTEQQETADKNATKAKKKDETDGFHLPVLVEFTYTFSVVFLVFVFLAMASISWITGTTLVDFMLRTSTAVLVLGGLLITVSRQVATGVFNASIVDLIDVKKNPSSKKTENPEEMERPKGSENAEKPEDTVTQT